VPGGTFLRDNGMAGNFKATVSSFRMDTYEVSVGRFRKFLEDYESHRPAAGSGNNVNNPNDAGWDPEWDASLAATGDEVIAGVEACDAQFPSWSSGDDRMPMTCMDWFEAYAFCIWDGGRLPTDAERNYAAAGGAQQRHYPWSVPPNSEDIDPSYSVYLVEESGQAPTPLDVGSCSPKGDGRWGQADLSGNVWEWVQDWYRPYPDVCVDCASLDFYSIRTIRGGSFYGYGETLLTSSRLYHAPNIRDFVVGVRCVRSP
jgi:formylglycine-generating enzyme required for sulfatase activity